MSEQNFSDRTNIFKKQVGSRIHSLYANDNNKTPIDIKEDTLNKYIRGDRFPNVENLLKIREHYNVPYSYLFGDIDNKELDSTSVSCKLGLSGKSIKILEDIMSCNNQTEKDIQMFAINQLLTKIDFLSLGESLLVPNEENKNIPSNKFYEYYSDYKGRGGSDGIYTSPRYANDRKSDELDYNDYKISKQLFSFFYEVRNSKECAELFMKFVDAERSLYNELLSTPPSKEITEEEIVEDYKTADKIMNEMQEQAQIKNQDIINKRKKDLGI